MVSGGAIFFPRGGLQINFLPSLIKIFTLGGEKVVLAGLGKLTSRPDFFIITGIFSIGIFALSCMCIY